MEGSPAGSATRCCCQTFSKRVRGASGCAVIGAHGFGLLCCGLVSVQGAGWDCAVLPRVAVGLVRDVPSGSTRMALVMFWSDAAAGERLGGPAGDAVDERCGEVVRASSARGWGRARACTRRRARRWVLLCLIQSMAAKTTSGCAAAEVDPEQAARGAEVDDAAGDGEVAVVVGERPCRGREEVERGVGERAVALVRLPQKVCGAVKYCARRALKRGSCDELVLAAVWWRLGVLPEPLRRLSRWAFSCLCGDCGAVAAASVSGQVICERARRPMMAAMA